VARVSAEASTPMRQRGMTSRSVAGEIITVEVPTTVNGTLALANGANVTLSHSWDVWKHRRVHLEIYGTEGAMLVPDPNWFGGEPQISKRDSDWQPLDISAHPFGTPNRTTRIGTQVADYRIIGLLDMAAAIRAKRAHRADCSLGLHVLEVLDAFERSSTEARHITIETTCNRPDPVPDGSGEEVFS
jgi:predicted dehydrogenase